MKEIIVKLNMWIDNYKDLKKRHPKCAHIFDSLIKNCEEKKQEYINDPNVK